jgi:predicted phage terminase large subunit-like protein
MTQATLTYQTAEEIANDQAQRRLAAKSLLGFALIYLPHYFTLPKADFHPELINLLEDWKIDLLAIAGFRGSAKSTLGGLTLLLWAALEQKAKFIIPINETDDVVKLTIANIRQELESNELILADYGRLIDDRIKATQFTQTNVLLANGCRILGRSRGQKIRGLRHQQYRPDLVVIDDPEEREKVQKKEYRDKTEQWLRGDVIPSIEETKARLIVIGNVLHTDSLMARLQVDEVFVHREYSLLDKNGKCTWRGKYPDDKALKKQEAKVGRIAWMREYLLKVVPPDDQEVEEDWIQYYDKLPKDSAGKGGVGVDLAISKKETADFTAMVSGILSLEQAMPKIYVIPNPVNERLSFHETIEQMKSIHIAMRLYAHPTFYIEDVAYQKAAIQEANRHMLSVQAMKAGNDKRSRLRTAATYIQNGVVLFPRKGCEDLIAQLLGFGVEDHDDLVDALVYLILGLSDDGLDMPEVTLLG